MKDYYRLLVEQCRDTAQTFEEFKTMILLLKHANIEDVAVINEVINELAGDTERNGIRVIR